MKITKLIAKDFLSIDTLTVNFEDYDGITVIKGKNYDTKPPISNGSGKSAIIEAVVWGLFGKTLRKTVDKTVSNFGSTKGCFVELHLNNNIVIKRAKKPNRLQVIYDGTDISKESSPQTQASLENLLNISFKSTLASMVFGQHSTINFISATPEEKRRLIEKYLGIEKIFELRRNTLSLKSEANLNLKATETKLGVFISEISNTKEGIKKQETILKVSKDILSNPKVISLLENSTLEEILEIDNNKEMLLASITSNEKESNLLDSTITRHINLVSFLDKEEGCSSCGYIDPEQKKKLKETKKEESDFRKRKKECEKEIIRDKKKYDSINLDISASDLDVLSKITSTTKHLNYLKETKKRHQREINKLKKDLLKYKKRYEILRFWEKAFSEKGLIKYIIRNILGYLNGQSNYYVSFLSQQFYMNLKDDLSIDIFQGAVKKDYNILSGGERRRLDLAITLALNDLTATVNNSSSNIVFFDEAVENLDKEGIKGFSTLLESIAKNKKLFIITHSQYLTELLHKANTIKVKKKKGKTSI